jgi:hypothetical protein
MIASMQARIKWLWIVSVANVGVAVFLVWVLHEIMRLLAAFAAGVLVSGWCFALLSVGLVLSFLGLWLARGVASPPWRWLGYVVNGCALLPHAAVIIGMGALFISVPKERFIIPAGYNSNVYVLYGVADGKPEHRTFWGVTHHIPQSGILLTQASKIRGMRSDKYYYQEADGTLVRIRHVWPSTIHPTPENLANDKDIGVYALQMRTMDAHGGPPSSSGCSVEYLQFYVGTKARLLAKPQEDIWGWKDIYGYVRSHPIRCSGQSN